MILTAYLDESGTHGKESPLTVVGGVMASANWWDRYEQDFDVLRKRHGFRIFHTKKFKKRTGDFKGWPQAKCMDLMRDMGALTEHARSSFRMMLRNEDYDSYYASGDKPRKLRLDSKTGLCFRYCLLWFLLEAIKRKRAKPGKPLKLHFVLERGNPNWGDAARIFDEESERLKKHGVDILGELTLADKDQPPLMLADFVAHTGFTFAEQHAVRAVKGGASPAQRGRGTIAETWFDPEGLAKLRREMTEALQLSSGKRRV